MISPSRFYWLIITTPRSAWPKLLPWSPSVCCRRCCCGERIGCSAYTEPACGSDLAALTTTAAKSPGGWTLNGARPGSPAPPSPTCLSRLRRPSLGRADEDWPRSSSRQIDPALYAIQRMAVQGGHAIGAGGFQLVDYLAPDETLVDLPGGGFQRAIGGINGARTYVAAMCAGMLECRAGDGRALCRSRTAFGKPLVDFQGLRWSLVDVETDLAALRLVTYRAARRIDAGRPADADAARAKKLAGERTVGHLAACLQALGAEGSAKSLRWSDTCWRQKSLVLLTAPPK